MHVLFVVLKGMREGMGGEESRAEQSRAAG